MAWAVLTYTGRIIKSVPGFRAARDHDPAPTTVYVVQENRVGRFTRLMDHGDQRRERIGLPSNSPLCPRPRAVTLDAAVRSGLVLLLPLLIYLRIIVSLPRARRHQSSDSTFLCSEKCNARKKMETDGGHSAELRETGTGLEKK